MRGAAAGIVAAAAWAASEPLLGRLLRTPYSDVRLLGRLATRGRGWPAAGLTLHLLNGAAFGAALERLGLHSRKQAIVAAEVENLVLWPALLLVDRIHPDRRDNTWPRLFTSRRVLAYEILTHALFGALVAGSRKP
jgi:hypothetical protein